jgi:hypothetical protein
MIRALFVVAMAGEPAVGPGFPAVKDALIDAVVAAFVRRKR